MVRRTAAAGHRITAHTSAQLRLYRRQPSAMCQPLEPTPIDHLLLDDTCDISRTCSAVRTAMAAQSKECDTRTATTSQLRGPCSDHLNFQSRYVAAAQDEHHRPTTDVNGRGICEPGRYRSKKFYCRS